MYSEHVLSRYLAETQHHPISPASMASVVMGEHHSTQALNPPSVSALNSALSAVRGKKKHVPLDPAKAVNCPECMKQFSHDFHLKIHMRSHTGERPFECSVCTKRFTQKGNLDTHMRKHTGDRPFKCEVCAKCFTQKGNMETHMRLHTGEKPFQCVYCEKRFYQQGGLRNHKCCNDPGTEAGTVNTERRGRKPTYANTQENQKSDEQQSPPLITPKQEPISHVYLPGRPVFSEMLIKQEQRDAQQQQLIENQRHQQQQDNNSYHQELERQLEHNRRQQNDQLRRHQHELEQQLLQYHHQQSPQ